MAPSRQADPHLVNRAHELPSRLAAHTSAGRPQGAIRLKLGACFCKIVTAQCWMRSDLLDIRVASHTRHVPGLMFAATQAHSSGCIPVCADGQQGRADPVHWGQEPASGVRCREVPIQASPLCQPTLATCYGVMSGSPLPNLKGATSGFRLAAAVDMTGHFAGAHGTQVDHPHLGNMIRPGRPMP